jgi:hypothetical protein
MCSKARWKFGCVIRPRCSVRAESRACPRTSPNAIRNPLETPSRYLFLAVPGGLDEWFDAVANANRDGLLDDSMFDQLSEDFGIGWLE